MTTRWAMFLAIAGVLLVADVLIWQSKLAEPISEPRPPLPMYRVYVDPTPSPMPSPWPGWPAGR